jgi:hypothetical protein
MGRVGATAALELRATLANPLLWGLVLLAPLATLTVNPAAMIPSGDAEVGGIRPFSNSRYALAQVFALSGLLFYAILPAMIAGNALLRDDDARIGELLHCTPLSAGEYVAGKLAGVLGALGTVVTFQVALAMAWNELGGRIGADTWPGPFRVGHYLEPALVFLLPGLLCCVALAFAAAEWTRTAIPVHATGVGLFVVTLAGLIPGTERLAPGLDRAFALLDIWGALAQPHGLRRRPRHRLLQPGAAGLGCRPPAQPRLRTRLGPRRPSLDLAPPQRRLARADDGAHVCSLATAPAPDRAAVAG